MRIETLERAGGTDGADGEYEKIKTWNDEKIKGDSR